MPSPDADELVLLATLTALGLSRGRSVADMTLVGSFLAVVTDAIFLLAAVQEIEKTELVAEKAKQEEEKKEKEEETTEKRLAELEKTVAELKALYGKKGETK